MARHTPGMSNIQADRLSRERDASDWSLSSKIFATIDHCLGPHDVDRFANSQNTHLTRYNSRWLEPGTEAVDALAQDWSGTHSYYVNAPFCLLPKVLQLIQRQKVTAIIVAPVWPTQPWFQLLQQMKIHVAPTMIIPNISASYRAPTAHAAFRHPEPLKNSRWALCASKISGVRL